MEQLLDKTLANFGFLAMLIVLMLIGFYKIAQWIVAQYGALLARMDASRKEEREQHVEREKCYRDIIDRQQAALDAHTKALDAHTAQAKDYYNEHKTAHEFQRSEHERLASILDGISEAVGRINGYKDGH